MIEAKVYNFEGKEEGVLCLVHKMNGMVKIEAKFDQASSYITILNAEKSYLKNYLLTPHQLEDLYDMKSTEPHYCEFPNCLRRARLGFVATMEARPRTREHQLVLFILGKCATTSPVLDVHNV